jgi:hypothetical protein
MLQLPVLRSDIGNGGEGLHYIGEKNSSYLYIGMLIARARPEGDSRCLYRAGSANGKSTPATYTWEC